MVVLVKTLQVILALSVLILLHELGHFLWAKLFRIRVDKFFLFFDIGGAKLFSTKDLRVDDDALEAFQVVVGVGDHVPVHDDHAEAHPDLRGGEAATVRPGQGVPEVLDEGVEFVFLRKVGFGGLCWAICSSWAPPSRCSPIGPTTG